MIRFIDNFLNSITMYRVVLYGLIILAVISLLLSFSENFFYKPHQLIFSFIVLSGVCFFSNIIISRIIKAPINVESSLITALILFFILLPAVTTTDYMILIISGVVAMASKYIFAIRKKHVFNPAAISVFFVGLAGFGNAGWWVGSDVLLPFSLIIGFLIVRKIRRFHLFFSFIVASLMSIGVVGLINGLSVQSTIPEAFVSWPLIFFGTVMLTEPLTTPPTKKLHMLYGGVVGFLFGLQFEIGPIFSSPELALLLGNIFSYLVSPKQKLFLKLQKKVQLAENVYEFIFQLNQRFSFHAGQYLEWTLPKLLKDSRGNRRYFTIASSPTEQEIKLGVKIQPNGSSDFKKILASMQEGDTVVASQLTGDFVLPDDSNKKLVFIAGGIGVTPFRSIIKYLVDTKQKRDIVFFYVVANPNEIAYKDIFDAAQKNIPIKVLYVITNEKNVPEKWSGKIGRITQEMIQKEVPDYKDRIFYISGPNAMVHAYQSLLAKLSVPHASIVTDYFPGF